MPDMPLAGSHLEHVLIGFLSWLIGDGRHNVVLGVRRRVPGRKHGGDRVDITAAMREHEDRIMRLTNVTGIGIGEKEGRPVIKVFVSLKLPEAELSQDQIVPRTLEGYATDVEEIGIVMAQPR